MSPLHAIRRLPAGLIALALASLTAGAATAAPSAEAWARWTRHDPNATGRVDHAAWDAFLQRYVSTDRAGLNRLAYGRVSANDKAALKAYLERLGGTPVSRLARDEQRAFWINLYNALTVDVVLDHYPVASIRDIDISPGLFSNGPWGKKLIRIEGVEVSLDDVEHRILRPIWQDPRVHYAVNCASVGCPNLMQRAFTAENTESLLDAGARAYINSPRGVSLRGNRATVSSIYSWFQEDFGDSEAGVLAHVRQYAEPALRKQLETASIAGYDYDWSLNDAR